MKFSIFNLIVLSLNIVAVMYIYNKVSDLERIMNYEKEEFEVYASRTNEKIEFDNQIRTILYERVEEIENQLKGE